MKPTLAIGLLSLFCLSCNATDIAATRVPQESSQRMTTERTQATHHKRTAGPNTPVSTPIDDSASITAATPQYSGEVGTITDDRALSEFLLAHDGKVVNLALTTSHDNINHGENWLSLCGEADASDNCTALHINYEPATEYDRFWQASGETNALTGFYIVRLNPGIMHQGFLSVSLLGMP